jgi:hypothetical protein
MGISKISKWFKGQMFGGKILQTVGSVKGRSQGLTNCELKVHIIEEKELGPSKSIGIELIAKSFLSYQMLPITLSSQETKRLIALLEEASKY